MKINKSFRYNILIGVIFFLLLLLPVVIQGKLYFVGGDDTKLYYIFPEEFLKNFTVNIISDNTLGGANTGYGTAAHFIPFLIVISFLKKALPFVNVQFLMYGLNYAFAFLFFYLFLTIWLKTGNFFSLLSKITASLFYVFSPFLVETLYKNQLISVYLISLMPAMLYLFSRAVINRKYIYTLVAVLLFSVFSTTLNTLPWSLPILITSVPVFAHIFWKHKKSFLINSLIFTVMLLALNFFWIFHFVNSNISGKGVASSKDYYSTLEYRQANIEGILNLTRLMNPLVPVLTKVDYSFKKNFSLFYLKNIIFIGTIAFAGILLNKSGRKKLTSIYWVSIGGFLLSWFLFSPNFGNWGPNYFLKFVTTFPFGIMFRNMFDKFSMPLAFYYSFSLAVSLSILNRAIKKNHLKFFILVLVFAVILSNAKFFIKPSILSENATATITGEFNQEFLDLIDYLKKLDNASRVLWLPMTAPNFVNVEDKYLQGHYYSGLTPLRILAGRGDYAGRFSFMIPTDVFFGDQLLDLLKARKYEEFGKIMQKMNARYVIYDKQELPEEMKSYQYDQDRKYLRYQDQGYKDAILGEKLKDFGNRYSLYLIKEEFISDRIYLTDNFNEFPKTYEGLNYKKISSYLYEIRLNDLAGSKKLVFLDPFYRDWTLYLKKDGKKVPFKKGENSVVYNWANGWEIHAEQIKDIFGEQFYESNSEGEVDVTFDLYFEPQKYNHTLYVFTVIVYSLAGLAIVINLGLAIKSKLKRNV